MELTTGEKINVILTRKNISKTELSYNIGISRQNLGNQLKRNNFPENMIRKIAAAIGCDVEIIFTDKENGEKI